VHPPRALLVQRHPILVIIIGAVPLYTALRQEHPLDVQHNIHRHRVCDEGDCLPDEVLRHADNRLQLLAMEAIFTTHPPSLPMPI